ncbi:thioredoxin [Acidobacteria bacterium AH-259-A15]|nr:thioredoxin [Acidobacteria bacterium AH-259-A15]
MQEEITQWTVDVAEDEFSEKVLKASHKRPVVVDFWASWCAPCRMLAPVLEKIAQEFRGAFILARVNTEEAPGLASHFQIRSIPFVMLFKDAEPVDEFVGALPETEIRRFLKKHCSSAADQMVSLGREKMESGDFEVARRYFRQALTAEPSYPTALLGLARVAWEMRNLEEMEGYLKEIDPASREAEEGDILKARVRLQKLCEEFGGLEACRQHAEKNVETQYQLGCCLAAKEHYREALETLLSVVAKDRAFRDEAPRKAMLDIFKIVGNRSPLAEEYRTRLSRTIF